MSESDSLDVFLGSDEPFATFHDAELLSLAIDYGASELLSEWRLYVGDPDASSAAERERMRAGRLRLTGLAFWVVDPPDVALGGGGRSLPWLNGDGPLAGANTETAAKLAALVPAGARAWYLYFADWNAFAYCAASGGTFEWTS